jgi:hypothetical protein
MITTLAWFKINLEPLYQNSSSQKRLPKATKITTKGKLN